MEKHLYFFILLLCSTLVSCVESPSSKLESQAKDTFKVSYSKLIEDDKDAKLESTKTVFSNDSLCILHVNVKSKNGLGVDVTNKVEYLFLSQDGKFYEAFQDLDDDSVYISEPTLKKISKGTFYEDLDFANAILYRTAIYINSNGREVGNPDAEFSIPIPTGTGLWELDAFDDEFGDKTNEKYIRLTGKGVFSNSAATNEKLIVHLFLDKERISFRLIEYGSHVVKEDTEICYFKIKDGDGEIHRMMFWAMSNGYIEPFKTQTDEFKEIIEKEGELAIVVEFSNYSQRSYQFKLKLDGLKKAMSYL